MILKISLRPLDKFFFGGEGSFREDDKDDSRRSTYLLHSRYFPQQTGVLGLVRNQLLLQSGLLESNASRMSKGNRHKAKMLIGPQNFVKEKTDDFGVIQRISPVFLLGAEGAICTPAPLDDRTIPDPEDEAISHPIQFQLDKLNETFLPRLAHYREKEELFAQVQHPSQGNTKLTSLFVEKERVGITKAAKPWGNEVAGKDDEGGYYYQTFLQFCPKQEEIKKNLEEKKQVDPSTSVPVKVKIKKNLEEKKPPFLAEGYVFFVEIKEEVQDADADISFSWTDGPTSPGSFTLKEALVEFGGERSVFNMQVEKQAKDTFPEFSIRYVHAGLAKELKGKVKRLVCLSPAQVDTAALRKKSYLIVSKTISFRFLSTSVDHTEHYQHLIRSGNSSTIEAPVESKLFHLLDRGSVVYYDKDKEGDILTLFDQKDFQKIGYNQYHIL